MALDDLDDAPERRVVVGEPGQHRDGKGDSGAVGSLGSARGFVDVKRYQNLSGDKLPSWYEQKLWGWYDVPGANGLADAYNYNLHSRWGGIIGAVDWTGDGASAFGGSWSCASDSRRCGPR